MREFVVLRVSWLDVSRRRWDDKNLVLHDLQTAELVDGFVRRVTCFSLLAEATSGERTVSQGLLDPTELSRCR